MLLAVGLAGVLGLAASANSPDPSKAPVEATSAPRGPQRIVTIAPNSAEVLCALGVADRIVGVSKFCVYPPELIERPRVGGLFDPDLERIVALRPDLLVLRGRSDSVESLCDRLDIPIYFDRTETLADVETGITELGRYLGCADEARSLRMDLRRRLQAIRDRVTGRQRPGVLLTVARRPGRLANVLTTGKGTFLHEMLEIAGGRNVFGHVDMPYPQVSAEGIVARRPEVIVELMPEVELTPAIRQEMLEQWRQLQGVPALDNDRVYFLTEDNCLIPSPRYVEIIERLSRLLHSEDEIEP